MKREPNRFVNSNPTILMYLNTTSGGIGVYAGIDKLLLPMIVLSEQEDVRGNLEKGDNYSEEQEYFESPVQ